MTPKPVSPGIYPASRSAGRPGTGQRPAWAAVTLLAASAGVIAACGAGPAGPPPGPSRPVPAHSLAEIRSSQLGAQILGSYFPATARQYAEGARLSGLLMSLQSQLTSACMARHGFSLPAIPVAVATAHIWDLSQFPDISLMKRTGLMVPVVTDFPRPQAPPRGRQRAYRGALARCTALAGQPFGGLRSATQALSGEWITIFTNIQASPRVRHALAGFSSCVRQAGAPAGYSQNFNRFAAWAAGQMTVPSTGAVRPALDRRWGAVFVRCGGGLAALQENLQRAAQARFFARHNRQVRQLVAAVSQFVASTERSVRSGGAN